MSATILGRAWFYDTGDPPSIDLWEHALVPMELGKRSGEQRAHEHLYECYDESQLRELLEVPAEGNFQVLFKGTMDGKRCGPWEAPESEWDEWFEVEESKCEPIPAEFMKYAPTDC